jgi:hypothetical protein
MVKITFEISSCRECPFLKTRDYSTDGFDRVEDWHCKKADKTIAGCVDWHEKPAIPKWCPLRAENTPKRKTKKSS